MGRRTVGGGDFSDQREIEAFGQVFEPAAHWEFGWAVDVVYVLQAAVLHDTCHAAVQGEKVRGRGGKGGRTRRMNRHGRGGRRGAGAEIGTALRNHAP